MCRECSRRGHECVIYTTNAHPSWRGVIDIPLKEPIDVKGAKTWYFPVGLSSYYKLSPQLAGALRREIPNYDIVDIHGLYQFPSTIAARYCRLYKVPYVLRPHGTLDPFIFRHHRPRKWVYEVLLERRNLEKAGAVHFTSQEEMDLAASHGFQFHGVVVPLGVDLEPPCDHHGALLRSSWPEVLNRRVVLFLSRINFKKGLDISGQSVRRSLSPVL